VKFDLEANMQASKNEDTTKFFNEVVAIKNKFDTFNKTTLARLERQEQELAGFNNVVQEPR
jgi:hypothetical protein